MADETALARWKAITLKLFPWLARIGLASSGALAIKSAASRTELEGGGPALLRVGDVGRLAFDPGNIGLAIPPALYYSPDASSSFAPTPERTSGAVRRAERRFAVHRVGSRTISTLPMVSV